MPSTRRRAARLQYAFQDNPFIGDDTQRRRTRRQHSRRLPLPCRSRRRLGRSVAAHHRRQWRCHHSCGRQCASRPIRSTFRRPPLVADFTFNGETITVVNNHFSSKTGSGALMGDQPPFNSAEDAACRAGPGGEHLRRLAAGNGPGRPGRGLGRPQRVRVRGADAGSLGKGHLSRWLGSRYDAGIHGRQRGSPCFDVRRLAVNQRYDYVFDGSSQSLDQMYVTHAARRTRSTTSFT